MAVSCYDMEQIFRTYYSRLCHFAWQMVHDADQAEDIVQDAFANFWNNRHAVADDEIAIKNYLYSTVRNACFNISRHAKVEDRYLQLNREDVVEESAVLANIIRAEVMDEVYKIVRTMPQGCQDVFRLGYLEGLSNLKIAEQLNISVNTVKTQKQRGLKIIRGKLNPEFFALLVLFFS